MCTACSAKKGWRTLTHAVFTNRLSDRSPAAVPQGAIVAIENPTRNIYGFQFHPEVSTEHS